MSKKNDKSVEENKEKSPERTVPSNRRVMLFGRMENDICMPAVKRILRLNDRDPQTPIDLLINSSGGNGYNADAIIAVMYQISAPVNTICLGHALSGACEILASGTGKRSAYEFATLMFHQTIWEADGDITNLEIQAKQGQKFREAQIELLHRCTGRDKKQLRGDIERDFYLSAQEALNYGIIDEIIHHCPESRRNSQSSCKGHLLTGNVAQGEQDENRDPGRSHGGESDPESNKSAGKSKKK